MRKNGFFCFVKIIFIGILAFGLFLQDAAISAKGNISGAGNTSEQLDDYSLNKAGLRKIVRKQYSDAKKYFLLAIKKNPSVKYYYNNLSVSYINLKEYKKAYKNLQIAVAIDPDYVKALSNMAVTCFHLFRFREAYGYYMKAKRVDRRYTQKRFERRKVIRRIEKIKRNNPGRRELDQILEYLRLRK